MSKLSPPLPMEHGKAEGATTASHGSSPDLPPLELFNRLKCIAGLIRDAGGFPRPGRYLSWRKRSGGIESRLIDRDLVVGRSPQCDLVLAWPRVSRRHFLVRHHPEADILVDLDSSNGTVVNGVRLADPRVLRDGDMIVAGGVTLLMRIIPRRRHHAQGMRA